jgi:PIN domain nuclease of toxin-antitoxin system
MKFLLDSHTALWMIYEPQKLSRKVEELLRDRANERVVSYITFWEFALKTQRGKLPALGSSVAYMMKELDELQVPLLRIRRAHILAMEKLEMHHGDPFDRMLIAQAAVEGLTLVTADATMRRYGVPTFW